MRTRQVAGLAAGFALLACAAPASHAAVGLEQVANLSTEVTFVAAPPGDRRRLFIVERRGRIRLVRDGTLESAPFLDITRRVSGSGLRGLLSMAFAPDYARSRRFYVFFNDLRGNIRVEEFSASAADPDRALPSTSRRVMFIRFPRHPADSGQHIAGQLEFGPDRLLYISLGDGGTAFNEKTNQEQPIYPESLNAQSLRSLFGKILRIDPRRSGPGYRVPRTNPFVSRRAARPEIYAYGLRNPWRFSFDGSTDSIAIGDDGNLRYEEIDLLPRRLARGANFGWPAYEGSHRFRREVHVSHPIMPAFDYPWRHTPDPDCGRAVIGGYVVRDRSMPDLYGRYVYGDLCTGELRAFNPARPRPTDRFLGLSARHIYSFGEDGLRRVYVALKSGVVYRLVEH